MKLYTFGCVMDGPGSRTNEPVPKEITGKEVGALDRRRWASMERLLLEAQTVQNFSFQESVGWSVVLGAGFVVVVGVSDVVGVVAAPDVSMASVVEGIVVGVAMVEEAVSGGGGGGGGF